MSDEPYELELHVENHCKRTIEKVEVFICERRSYRAKGSMNICSSDIGKQQFSTNLKFDQQMKESVSIPLATFLPSIHGQLIQVKYYPKVRLFLDGHWHSVLRCRGDESVVEPLTEASHAAESPSLYSSPIYPLPKRAPTRLTRSNISFADSPGQVHPLITE